MSQGKLINREMAMAKVDNEAVSAVTDKLQAAALKGNLEAIKTFYELRDASRWSEMIRNIDDDEFALQALQD